MPDRIPLHTPTMARIERRTNVIIDSPERESGLIHAARTAIAFCIGSAVAAFQLVFGGNSICLAAWLRLGIAAGAVRAEREACSRTTRIVMFSIVVGGYTIVDITLPYQDLNERTMMNRPVATLLAICFLLTASTISRADSTTYRLY